MSDVATMALLIAAIDFSIKATKMAMNFKMFLLWLPLVNKNIDLTGEAYFNIFELP